jgi:Glucosidase II beta subunit-like protein
VDQTSGTYNIEYVTSLGEFSGRNIVVDLEHEPPNDYAEELPELGRVVDLYDKGEMCGAANAPRRSYVHYQCCSRRVIMTRQGVIIKDGVKITTDIANVLDVVEAKTCEYNSTICTPLLCGDDEDLELDDGIASIGSSSSGKRRKRELEKFKPKENETIQEILDRSLGDECILKVVDWWTYQFCNKAKIRQYHEELGNTDMTDHVLGKYKEGISELPSRSWGDEWNVVVNSTSDDSSAHNFIQGTENTGSTKTYYEVSYIDGDVCDGHDVKDSAIVAGSITTSAGSTGDGTSGNTVLKRSTSVRYYCGSTLDFTINEDSTCHYVLQVTVPQLCVHPLFHEPIPKKQIMKCLPALLE